MTNYSPTSDRLTPRRRDLTFTGECSLHGLETTVAESHPQAKVIRYADDLVVLHPELTVVEEAEKTRRYPMVSTHGTGTETKQNTHHPHIEPASKVKVGFDFLGFHIRQYPSWEKRIQERQADYHQITWLQDHHQTQQRSHTATQSSYSESVINANLATTTGPSHWATQPHYQRLDQLLRHRVIKESL